VKGPAINPRRRTLLRTIVRIFISGCRFGTVSILRTTSRSFGTGKRRSLFISQLSREVLLCGRGIRNVERSVGMDMEIVSDITGGIVAARLNSAVSNLILTMKEVKMGTRTRKGEGEGEGMVSAAVAVDSVTEMMERKTTAHFFRTIATTRMMKMAPRTGIVGHQERVDICMNSAVTVMPPSRLIL
jgi:hypothetical protein